MPNWCYNHLKVTAKTKDQLDDFIEKTTDVNQDGIRGISFDKACPIDTKKYMRNVCLRNGYDMPTKDIEHAYGLYLEGDEHISLELFSPIDHPSERNSKGDLIVGRAFDWYRAHLENWGTKWPCDFQRDAISRISDTEAEFAFETAWAPCDKVIAMMAENFPELNFDFYATEEGNGIYAYGDNDGGTFSYEQTDYPAPSQADRVAALRDEMCNQGLDPDKYDLDAIVESGEVYFLTAEDGPGYGGNLSVHVEDVYDLDQVDLSQYENK